MKWFFLAVFVVFTFLHLFASAKNNKYFRDITKGFILFSLLGYYVTSVPTVNWFIVLAIVFSWIGDLLLILKGVKWFAIGGVSFMISHIFFIISYSQITTFSNIPLYAFILLGAFFAAAVIVIFYFLKKHLPKGLFVPMFLYLLINGTMNCFAIFRLIGNFGMNSMITAIGAILFFVSDSCLFFVRFKKDTKQKSHFIVMLTYSLGEFLILLGLTL